jgi:Protein of unknown function (DUF3618)
VSCVPRGVRAYREEDEDTDMAERVSEAELLEREIERSRADLARAIDGIADRVSPSRAARRGVRRLRESVASFTATVDDALHPFDAEVDGGGAAGGAGVGVTAAGRHAPGAYPGQGYGRPGPHGAEPTVPPEYPELTDLKAEGPARGGLPPAALVVGAGVALAVTAVAVVALRRRWRRR